MATFQELLEDYRTSLGDVLTPEQKEYNNQIRIKQDEIIDAINDLHVEIFGLGISDEMRKGLHKQDLDSLGRLLARTQTLIKHED